MALGPKMTPTASKEKKVSPIWNLVTRMRSLKKKGMEVARLTNGVDGRGCFKKQTPVCNGQDRGLCLSLKRR
jgi:hypothetical protein